MKKILFPVLVVALVVLTAIPALPAQAAPADGDLPTVTWLPPLSNQGEFQLKDGSTLPIKFTLTDPDTGAFVEDTSLKVDINEVLFRDDFNDGDAEGWTPVGSGGSWAVEDDSDFGSKVYSQEDTTWTTTTTYDTYWRSYGDGSWTDYTVEAKVKIVGGGFAPIAGIFFRVQGTELNSGYYLFRIDARANTGPALIKSPNSILAGGHPGYPQFVDEPAVIGKIYTLKVVVNRTNIKCYVDGVKKIELDDSTYASGCVGVGTFNAHVHFDDLMVLSLPAAKTFNYGEGSDNVRISYDTIFSDDFERVDIGPNWQWVSGTWAIEDDSKDDTATRVLSGEGGLYVGEVAGVSSWDSYIFEFDVKKVSGCYFQVVFGYQDLDHHYLLEPSADQVHIALFKKTGGGYIEMTATRPLQETNPGIWYHYKIVFTPSNIQIYCNGIEKFNVATDPSLTTGRIGVGAGIWCSSHAHFDNVMVQAPHHYIANLHTKESDMTTGEYLITVWSGSGDQLGTYLFDLTDLIQGMGRGKGKA